MSALRLLHSRTTRAFALASKSPLAMQHVFHPRHMSRLRPPVIRNLKKIKRLENQVAAVMANPNLDEQHKYRVSRRLCAEIDYETAFRDTVARHQKLLDEVHHLVGLAPEEKLGYYERVVEGVLKECLILERQLSSRLWQSKKLCISAPWGEVRVSHRVVHFAMLLSLNGVLSPIWRLSLRALLSIMGTEDLREYWRHGHSCSPLLL